MALKFEEQSYRLRGAIFEVYRELGCGFLESVYQAVLEEELSRQGIPFDSQVDIPIHYKGKNLPQLFRADLVCFGEIILELKAASSLNDEHRAQLFNYLKATGYELGLLVNFGHHPKVEIERIVL